MVGTEPSQGGPGANLIVGSSHVVRWRTLVAADALPPSLPPQRFIGFGGAPIWSERNFNDAIAAAGENGRVGVMVPDFRFGNSICLSYEPAVPVMRDGFAAISQHAMTPDNDRAMLMRCIAALQIWHGRFGQRARYLFWCMLGREVQDRLAGRYIHSGRYLHPVFRQEEIASALPSLNIIDLGPLLRMPMHEVVRLFVDSSAHPSQIGYRFLDSVLCQEQSTAEAYAQAVDAVESVLFELARRIRSRYKQQVLLTGRSVWLNTLVRHLGSTAASRLAAAGLLVAPLDTAPGQPSIGQLLGDLRAEDCLAVVFCVSGTELAVPLARAFGTSTETWRKVPHVDWETATIPIICGRNETPHFPPATKGAESAAHQAVVPNLEECMVELGPLGIPTWRGLQLVLEQLACGELTPIRPHLQTHGIAAIEDGALLTNEGIAFLVGGNHSVIRFATGELSPSKESLANFASNVESRRLATAKRQALFAHILFPDKQSVLSEKFPYQPVHRLGIAYQDALAPADRSKVLYPLDPLRELTGGAYLPQDTHLTDQGSLVVLRHMLDCVDIDAEAALARVTRRINKPLRWTGDLGRKFNPPLYQDGVVLSPDWPIAEFHTSGGFNDGMVDLVFSPEAQYNATILLFGDSFFRMMLRHLSAVFTRIVCLRSRFFHPEIAASVRPDVVFSGNAERYLSAVAPDSEAQLFSLYPGFLRAPEIQADTAFLIAWSAVTAPRSSTAQRFFSDLRTPLRDGSSPPFQNLTRPTFS